MQRFGRAGNTALVIALGVASVASSAFTDGSDSSGQVRFEFEDGLDGWTAEVSPGSTDTWEHTGEANGSRGAVALSGYTNDSGAAITSPTIDVSASSVLSLEATWWLEAGDYDFVDLEVRTDGGDWATLQRFEGRGRWPVWDPLRYELPVIGDVQIRFTYFADGGCDGVGQATFAEFSVGLGAWCGRGFWFDDVTVVLADDLKDEDLVPAWGDGPGATSMRKPSAAGEDLVGILTNGLASQATTHRPGTDDEAADQFANPDFLEVFEASGPRKPFFDWYLDPYLADWEGTLGRVHDFWFLNRYRTPLLGRLYAPMGDGPHPVLVFVGGYGDAVSPMYSSMLYRLVQEGYAILNVSPQGQARGQHGSAVLPAPEFCATDDPGAWWRQPQEGGFVEGEVCAGFEPGHLVEANAASYAEAYRAWFGTTYTFAVLDGLDWAFSDANPWASLLDPTVPVGTFGHSAGGYAALASAQLDDRIGAAVLLDSYGTMLELPASTPTLAIVSDNFDIYEDMFQNPLSVAEELEAAEVDTGFVFLENTGHYGSAWWPLHESSSAVFTALYRNPTRNPWSKPVGHHWLLHWFDLHLRGAADAGNALTAPTFDGSADRTAQGQGRYVAGEGNVPYRIEGRTVADLLDPRVRSWMHIEGSRQVLAGG